MDTKDSYIGLELEQNCGDVLVVTKKEKGSKYKGCFKKYPCELTFDIYNAKAKKVQNPQIEQVEFVQKIWQQNCGDKLKIFNEKKNGKWKCQFVKYPYVIYSDKTTIINGQVNNPQIEIEEFLFKKWKQNCGDILRVLKKTDKYIYNAVLFECEFINYPYKVLATKNCIKYGTVNNPQIEKATFIGKLFKQNCGDYLKVLRKTNEQARKKSNYLYECEFQKYPYRVKATKGHILNGCVDNPQIEKTEFIEKKWIQTCGDSLKIIRKTNKQIKQEFLWEANFINYPCTIFATKTTIKEGNVINCALPWMNKDSLIKFIINNFKEKPTLKELSNKIKLSYSALGRKINEFGLRDYISYFQNYQENSIRDFIKQYTECSDEEKSFKIEEKEYGLDICLPNLKLGIEYNGNYWHSSLYKEPNYHQKKSLDFLKENIRLIHVFEYEWMDERIRPILESMLKMNLGIFNKKVGASKCKIKELGYREYAEFCNENHIQGEAGAKVKLGLFYKEELIQIISFGKPRFSDKYEYEIIRECSKKDYIVIGGKEKLWNYFVKKYNPTSVLSYCDFSKFTGNSYLKLGFKKERLNAPGFVWFDEKNKQTFWRNPYKNQEMKSKGYLKIYDCGQLVFVWKNGGNY